MASTTGTSKTNLTPEELVDLEIPDEVRISPSGQQVVYSASPMGKKGEHKLSTIWMAQIGQEMSARQLTSGMYDDRMPQWSPCGDSIAFLSDRNDRGKACAIYILCIHGGEAYPITKAENERGISSFAWSPDGKFIAFLSPDEKTAMKKAKEKDKDDVMVYSAEWEYNRLRILHLTTREVENLYAQDSHVKAFVWSEDSKQIVYVLQDTPELDSPYANGVTFQTISIIDKTKAEITRFPGTTAGPMIWLDNGLYFVAGTEAGKCSTSATVYKLEIESKKYLRLPPYNKESCVGSLCRNGNNITAKVESGLLDEIYLCTKGVIGKHGLILSQDHKISSWDFGENPEGNHILVLVKSTVTSPRDLYSIQMNGNREPLHDMIQLSSHGQPISSLDIGISQDLRRTSSDGAVELDGLFLSPSDSSPMDNSSPNPLPTIVLIHGGPYYRVMKCFNTSTFHWSPLLLSSGKYGILLPNYRGGSSHGEGFARYARGGMGTVDYDDIIALVDEGIKQGLVDPDQIMVGGWSQGGFLSYLLAVRRNSQTNSGSDWKIKGAICGAGVTDWDMMSMTSDLPTFEAELAGMAPWQAGRDRGKADVTGRQGSAIWEMKAKAIPPILILHGEKDERVPLTQAVAFRRGCQYYGVPFEMAVYPREGHPIRERAHLIDMLKRVSRFCDMCLG